MASPATAPAAGALCVCSNMGMFCTLMISVCTPSSATVRGKDIDLVSASVLRNDSTAETPSALKNAVDGLKPRAVFNEMPPPLEGDPGIKVVRDETLVVADINPPPEVVGMVVPPGSVVVPVVMGAVKLVLVAPMAPEVRPLPKLTCCAASVPVQSTPLAEVMSLVVSTIFASINTWRVAASSLEISASTPGSSRSVVRMINLCVRGSLIIELRLDKVGWTSAKMFVGLL